MARRLSPREIGLVVVLAAAVLGYLWFSSGRNLFRPSGVASQTGGAGAVGAEAAPRIHMDLLGRHAEAYDPGGRDLFQFGKRPPSPSALKKQAEAKQRAKAARVARQKAPPPPPKPVGPPRPARPVAPPINLQYLGYLGPKDAKIAVFVDGKDTLLARKGEVVRKKFRVVDIKFDTVVMGYVQDEYRDQTRELAMARQ